MIRGNLLSVIGFLSVGLSILLLAGVSAAWAQESTASLRLNTEKPLERVLKLTRRIYGNEDAVQILNAGFKNVLTYGMSRPTETQVIIFLLKNPAVQPVIEQFLLQLHQVDVSPNAQEAVKKEKWYLEYAQTLAQYLERPEVMSELQAYWDPTVPIDLSRVIPGPGYRIEAVQVNHPVLISGLKKQAQDLKTLLIKTIRNAQHQIILNVFDFDLVDVAQELIEAKKRGLTVAVGIDKRNVDAKPEVKRVFDLLMAAGVRINAVDSSGLNHQKLVAVDWDYPRMGKVLLASGNFTQSCLGPEGDLKEKSYDDRFNTSKPNPNHMIVIKSDILSSLVHHELVKILNAQLRLKSKSFPVTGSYLVRNGAASVVLAFSPNGAVNNIAKNIIAREIQALTNGPILMAQFAFSSETIHLALLERLKRMKSETGGIDFRIVGDKPFSLQEWSIPLKMSGLMRIKSAKDQDRAEKVSNDSYQIDLTAPFRQLFSSEQEFLDFARKSIKIAPTAYQSFWTDVADVRTHVTIKVHHKLLVGGKEGNVVITGSFNFSTGAETNIENIFVFHGEKKVSQTLAGAVLYLHQESSKSVFQEAMDRNRWKMTDPEIKSDDVEAVAPNNCNQLLIGAA